MLARFVSFTVYLSTRNKLIKKLMVLREGLLGWCYVLKLLQQTLQVFVGGY